MTDRGKGAGAPRPHRPPRLTRGAVRLWAWVAGSLAFFTPWVALGLAPKPEARAAEAPGRERPHRPVIIVRRITRRVVIQDAPQSAPVQYVYTGGDSSGGGDGVSYAAPPPAPTTSTGGS